ncbi:MAG: GAF domain-containing protein [Chloroflexi bacterium]|nr:GAF domain-containing protein [Chloroflexota bacterium]
MSQPTPLALTKPRRSLRGILWRYSIALIALFLLLGGVILYFTLATQRSLEQSVRDARPVLLLEESKSLIDQALFLLNSFGRRMDESSTRSQEFQLRLVGRLLPIHSALEVNLREFEDYMNSLSPDDPLATEVTRLWALQRALTEAMAGIIQNANRGNWGQVDSLIRHFNALYRDYNNAYNFLLFHLEERQERSRERIQRYLTYSALYPWAFVALSTILVLGFATFLIRRLVSPIEYMAQGMLRFAEGDLSFRFPDPGDRDDEVSYLMRAFNAMAQSIQEAQYRLEHQVEERTFDLQRRMTQIQTAADIGRLVTSIRDLDELLERTVRLIAERFGYYHVGVFLVDQTGLWIELRAASSESGRQLLKRGLRLRIGQEGIVGLVARTGHPKVVLDVAAEPAYKFISELSLTRSEMALPLRVGDRILGVLDIQSTEPHAFSPADVTTMRIVADQLAVAIDNARLLQEMQRALESLRWAHRQLAAQGWKEYLQIAPAHAYRLDATGHFEALRLQDSRDGTQPLSGAPGYEVQIPITVRGLRVAMLVLRRLDRPWSASERAFLEVLSQRLGLALESARLFQMSQRRSHWLQGVVELSQSIRLQAEEDLLNTFVQEAQSRFGLWRVAVYLQLPDRAGVALRAVAGDSAETLRREGHQVTAQDRDPIAHVLRQGQWLFLPTPEAQQPYGNTAPVASGLSRLIVPLRSQDEILGVVDMHAAVPQAFLASDLPMLQLLADALSIALANTRLVAGLQRLLQEHQILQQGLTQITLAHTMDEALRKAAQILQMMDPLQTVAVYQVHQDLEDNLDRVVAAGVDAATMWPDQIPLDAAGVLSQAARERQALWWVQLAWEHDAPVGQRAFMAVPIVYGERLWGLLALSHVRADGYHVGSWELLQSFASTLAGILTNLELLDEVQARSEQLQTLYEFSSTLARHTKIFDLLDESTQFFVRIFRASHAAVFFFDGSPPKNITLVAWASSETTDTPPRFTSLPADSLPLERILEANRPVVWLEDAIQTLPKPWREFIQRYDIRSVVVAPLNLTRGAIGLVFLMYPNPMPDFDKTDRSLLDQMLSQLSLAVQTANLLAQLERWAKRERLIREITVKLRSTTDPYQMIQIAIQELRRALGASKAQLLFIQTPTAPSPTPPGAGEVAEPPDPASWLDMDLEDIPPPKPSDAAKG